MEKQNLIMDDEMVMHETIANQVSISEQEDAYAALEAKYLNFFRYARQSSKHKTNIMRSVHAPIINCIIPISTYTINQRTTTYLHCTTLQAV